MDEMTVREMAASLSVRLGTCYSLLWDGTVSARKNALGEWLVDRESVERYKLRRNLRRAASRRAMKERVIDVTATVESAQAEPPATAATRV